MGDPKGDHLFVNLSAAKTRQRLNGFGHGVRKIRSAGKNRAMIIHTATGNNLSELKHLFEDVGWANREAALSEPIENLRNIGPTAATWLRDAGIRTVADLEASGPVFAYVRARSLHKEVTRNLLWALVAGLQNRDWRDLTSREKDRLLDQIDRL